MVSFLLSLCFHLLPDLQKQKIYYGSPVAQHVTLEFPKCDLLLDLCYDEKKHCFYRLFMLAQVWFVEEWTVNGKLVSSWKLPKETVPTSSLVWIKGQLSVRASQLEKKPRLEGRRRVEGSSEWLRFKYSPITIHHERSRKSEEREDEAINPKLSHAIGLQIRHSSWSPSGDAHLINTEILTVHYPVNVPRGGDSISWNSDQSIIGLTKKFYSRPLILLRQKSGKYRELDALSTLRPHLSKGNDRDGFDILTSEIGKDSIVYGIQSHDREPTFRVDWLKVKSNNLQWVRSETGLFARRLK